MLKRIAIGTTAGACLGALLGYMTFDPAHNMGGMNLSGSMIAAGTFVGMFGLVFGIAWGGHYHTSHNS